MAEHKANNESTGDEGIPTASYGGAGFAPGEQIGPYKLLRILGEGGYGIVYLAERQRPIKRRVALKVIKPGMDTKQVIARFEAERQALALLDHPNIAHVFNAGTTEAGRPYFAMEYVKGVPITEHCDRYKLTIEERLKLFLSVCEAVQHAHQKAIIHRDIKPSNILVAYEGEKAVPMIIDFGVAKALSQSLTETTLVTQQAQMIGTPEYMSPEQAEMTGQDIDTSTDVYSLGFLLYELLTGTLPFDSQTLREGGPERMRQLIRQQDPRIPSAQFETVEREKSVNLAGLRRTDIRSLERRLHGELDWITLKAMDKDRTQRYQTAYALAEDIQRYLNQEPVLAGPPSTAYKLRKFVMRNRGLFVSTTAIAVVVVLAAVISITLAIMATKAQRIAENAIQSETEQRQYAESQELIAKQRAYSSDINLAAQALSVNDLGRARELLNHHRPTTSNVTDLRGWEWRFLWQQCQSEALDAFCKKAGRIHSLSISHDGKWLALGSFLEGGVSIWNLQTREKELTLFPDEWFVQAAFSPKSNLLATVSLAGLYTLLGDNNQSRIRFWDLTTQKKIIEKSLDGSCLGLAFSNDGSTLVTATTTVDSLTTTIDSMDSEHENRITLWSIPDGNILESIPSNMKSFPHGTPFALAHDFSFVVHPQHRNDIRITELSKGQTKWEQTGTEGVIFALALTQDDKLLASSAGYSQSAIRLWDVDSGKEIGRLEGHHSYITDLLFRQDDKKLVSASGDQTIRIWDVSNPREGKLIRTLTGHTTEVLRIALLPDNNTLISGDRSGTVLVWDLEALKQQEEIIISNIANFAFIPEDQGILALDRNGQVHRYRGEDFNEKHDMFNVGNNFNRYWTCISPEVGLLAVNSDGVIKIWTLSDGSLVHRLDDHIETEPITFLEKGRKLLTVNRERDIHVIWDLSAKEAVKSQSWPGASELDWCCRPVFIPNKNTILTTSSFDHAHRLKDIATQHESHPDIEMYPTSGITLSPDGMSIATSSFDGFVQMWDTTKDIEETATLKGFHLGAMSVTFSPNGKRLAVGGTGETEAVKILDVQSRQELITLPGKDSIHYRVAFSADGNTIGSLSHAGLLHLWRAPSWEEIKKAEESVIKSGK